MTVTVTEALGRLVRVATTPELREALDVLATATNRADRAGQLSAAQRERLDAASAGGWTPDGRTLVRVGDLRAALAIIDEGL